MEMHPPWASQWELPLRAARTVGLAKSTLHSAIDRGEIRTVTLAGGTVLVRLEDVRDLKESPRPVGRPPKSRASAVNGPQTHPLD